MPEASLQPRLPRSYAAQGLPLPPRRQSAADLQSAVPKLKAASVLASSMQRIIRPQAMGNWMLPSLAVVTPQYIEMILRGALGGNHVQQWELFDLMIDTWPRLMKNTTEIVAAVQAMDWRLEAWAEEDQPPTENAEERKKVVSNAAWRMRPEPDSDDNGFNETIADVVSAWWNGLTVLEILWEQRRVGALGDLTVPQATAWVHPTNYAWSDEGYLGLNPSRETSTGVFRQRASNVERFPEHKFIIAKCKAKSGPVMTSARLRALAWWWCAANFSADWLMNLAQLFGIPFRWATYDVNSADDTISTIGTMLANMGSAGYGAFPEGTNINFLEAGKSAGASPQDGLLDRADKNCDLLLHWETTTSEIREQGGAYASSKVGLTKRDQCIQAVANFAAGVLNQQLVPFVLRENYGDDEEAPYFCPKPEAHKDEKADADRDKVLLDSGVELPKKWYYQRHNIPLPQKGEETISNASTTQAGAPGKPAGAKQDLETDAADVAATELAARQALAAAQARPNAGLDFSRAFAALAADLQPVQERLGRILTITDPEIFTQKLTAFVRDLEQMKRDVAADPKFAAELARLSAAALAIGLQRERQP